MAFNSQAFVDQFLGIGQDPIMNTVAGAIHGSSITSGVSTVATAAGSYKQTVLDNKDTVNQLPADDTTRKDIEALDHTLFECFGTVAKAIANRQAPKTGGFISMNT